MIKKNKILTVSGIAILAFVVVYLAYLYWPGKKQITRFYENDPSKISRIEYVSGSDGRIRTITDIDDIKKITDILSTATFKRSLKDKETSGWSYKISIYEGNEEVFNLLQSYTEVIFGVDYKMSTSERDKLTNTLTEITDKITPGKEIGLN